MARYVILSLVLLTLVGCGAAPVPTPDAVATQVAVGRAAAATLTAEAPTETPTAVPTAIPTAPATPTASPTETRVAAPTASPPPLAPTAPPIGPVMGQFAVVNVASNDVLNVRTGPGVGYGIAGTIPYYGLGVSVHAGGQEVGGSWWVPVQYEGVSGWANNGYLARQVGWTSEAVAARAAQAIMALKDRDWQALAGWVHPGKGVRFSPYPYVRAEPGSPGGEDLVFTAAQMPGLWSDATVYHWGTAEGSGEPIDLTFAGYYGEYVYDVDFARPDVVGFGESISRGSMINNIAEVYPGAVTVEYHFEGFDPKYAGYDWRSLRLVLEESGGSWYLVGIAHDEWTP